MASPYTTHSGTCTELAEKYGLDFDLWSAWRRDLSNVASGLMRIEPRPWLYPHGYGKRHGYHPGAVEGPENTVASVINGSHAH